MKKQLTLILFLLMMLAGRSYATHIRAGDLTAVRISATALTYRFTATIYRDTKGVNPDETIEFDFGDGTRRAFPLVSRDLIGNETERLIYNAVHTFAGPAEYTVGITIKNRNEGVLNIPNSINTAFHIESTFLINPFLGMNNSPLLTIPPIDLAASRQIFFHNPGAVDIDGDSLSYRLTICKKAKGQNVDVYYPLTSVPQAPNARNEANTGPATLTLDPMTGDLIWDAPLAVGEYNIAFFVDEWRSGIRIGSVNRDMQILVRENFNRRPVITVPRDTCVVAGTLLRDTIRVTDPDRHPVNVTAFGGVFQLTAPSNKARFDTLRSQPPVGTVRGLFSWQTTCNDVSRQPYLAIFRGADFPTPERNRLVSIETWSIRVVGPPPQLVSAVPDNTTAAVTLNWRNYICPNAEKMTIWRREGPFNFNPKNCETGLPGYTGYQKIGEVDINQTTFLDNNNGKGLKRGATYCYRIFATFPDPKGGESYASTEVCVTIQTNAPFITNVSVERTSTTQGEIFVRWTKPLAVDENIFPRPYTFQVSRGEGLTTTGAQTRLPNIFAENDTSFTDRNLDTETKAYNYKVYFYSRGMLIDSSATATSVRLTAQGNVGNIQLSWQAEVPWSNTSPKYPLHYIYRESQTAPNTYDLIDSVNVTTAGFRYTDTGRFRNMPLERKKSYCYYVLTRGTYGNKNIAEPLLNKSQRACAIIRDTAAPCAPILSLRPVDCKQFEREAGDCTDTLYNNTLNWQPNLAANCDTEIAGYKLYFAATDVDSLKVLATFNANVLSYVHDRLRTFAGRYAVTAVDSAGNESRFSNIVENDLVCEGVEFYKLPNVITPNNDGWNDVFRPFPCPRFVEGVEFTVYNRWGQRVYNGTGDIYINWRGVNNAGRELSAGAYYYEAKVRFLSLRKAQQTRIIKGWIQIIR